MKRCSYYINSFYFSPPYLKLISLRSMSSESLTYSARTVLPDAISDVSSS